MVQNESNKYIGFKMLRASLMTLGDYNEFRGWKIPENEDPTSEGYKVVYPDGYVSWSPKKIFETSYMQVSENNTITQENVEKFIDYYDYAKMGEKTTVVKATLINGFVIVESSSCVDVNNYDDEIGKKICQEKIKNKIWELLGFLLQTAKNGIK